MKKSAFNLIKFISFFLIFCILFSLSTFVLRNKNEAQMIKMFYKEKRNSLDVVFVGSSHVMCAVYPLELWNKFEIKSYDFASSAQLLPASYYAAKEAINRQHPSLLVLDVSGVAFSGKPGNLQYLHVLIDNMKPSINKYKAIEDLLPNDKKLDFYFNIRQFHTRWKDLNNKDFKPIYGDKKGAYVSDSVQSFEKPKIVPKAETAKIDTTAMEYLQKIIDLCKKSNTKLLLINLPSYQNENTQKLYNEVYNIAENNDIIYLNYFHLLDNIKLDYSTDLRDKSHCNSKGAEKVTSHLGAYIQKNYNIPNLKNK